MMNTGFQDGAKRVGGGARTGANDAGIAPLPGPMMMGNNPYGSGAGAGFGGGGFGGGFGGGMGSYYGSMAAGGMDGPNGSMMDANKQETMGGLGPAGGMNGMPSAGNMFNSMYGPGGYAMTGSMYGGNSMYWQDIPNETIVVTKVFSSRRDLGSMASGLDFPRRFDSYWPSYRTDDGNGGPPQSAYMGSLYGGGGKNSALGNNADRDLPGPTGPTGADADGNVEFEPAAKEPVKESKKEPAKEPTKEPAKEPAKESVKEPTKEPTKEPAKEPAASPTADELAAREKQRAIEEGERRRRGEAAAQALAAETARQEALRAAEKSRGAAEGARGPSEAVASAPVAPAPVAQKPREVPQKVEEDDIPLARDDVAQQPRIVPQSRPQPPQEGRSRPQPPVVPPSKPPQPQQEPTPTAQPAQPAQPAPAATPQEKPERPVKPEKPAAEATERSPQQAVPHEKSDRPKRPHSRPHSRASRPVSRASSIDLVDFPKGEEVADEMAEGGLSDLAKIALEQARAERVKERQAQRAARTHELARAEEAARAREELARQRREAREEEERQRREAVARMDEERRRAHAAAVEAREREKEAERRRFEEAKAEEAAREAARVQALRNAAEQERAKEGDGAEHQRAPRSGSRPRSRRPQSRPTSGLRGAIPEQPPDLEVGQIKDTMSDGLGGKKAPAVKRSATPLSPPQVAETHVPPAGKTPSSVPQRRVSPGSMKPPTPVAAELDAPSSKKPPTPKAPSPQSRSTPKAPSPQSRSTPKAPSPQSRPTPKAPSPQSRPTPAAAATGVTPHTMADQRRPAGKQQERNPIRTLVLVERMASSNNAIQHDGESLRWGDHAPIEVTEIRERPQNSFNYRSEILHKICEVASRGFNVAVLSSEAPNTVSRMQSPVWSVLLRIVDDVLRSKTNDQGELKAGFQLQCALAYFEGTNAKDLFSEDSQPFRQLAVRPSPVSGPHLVDMTYLNVTNTGEFERLLTGALNRAENDSVLATLNTGFIGAYLTAKEELFVDGKKDVCISSINVTSAGSDVTPYADALGRTRGPYGTLLHLDVLGPCLTCFMYCVADDDSVQQSPVPPGSTLTQEISNTFQLLDRMSKTDNLPMRSGSVRRFVHYIRENQREVRARIDANPDMSPEKRAKLEKYLRESEALFHEYVAFLQEPTDATHEL